MTVNATTNLGLALPDQGEWDGTWGTNTNQQITELIDSAVAGTTTLSADADVTLSDTDFVANESRQAIILWTASNGATTRNVTAPARSKVYVVVNAGTGSIVLRGAGPTTGITIIAGEKCVAAWNGSDFVKVATTDTVSSISFGSTGLTPSTATKGAVTVAGTLAVANGGTGATTATGTGSVVLANSPTLTTPNLGTPSAATLTNATGLPISTGVSGLGTGVATFLATPSSANLASAVTDETGTGALVFANSPTLVTPTLGTPASATLTNATGLPLSTGVTGTLAITNGGTGQTTANTAFNALAPSQTGNSGKFLTTNGTDTSWATIGGGGAYTEGTWTPRLAFEGSSTGITYLGRSGNYTKIGKLVIVTGYIYPDALGSGSSSDQVTITNLPYAGAGAGIFSAAGDAVFEVNECVASATSVLFGMVVSGYIRIMYDQYNMVTRADFASGELQFRATYYTS